MKKLLTSLVLGHPGSPVQPGSLSTLTLGRPYHIKSYTANRESSVLSSPWSVVSLTAFLSPRTRTPRPCWSCPRWCSHPGRTIEHSYFVGFPKQVMVNSFVKTDQIHQIHLDTWGIQFGWQTFVDSRSVSWISSRYLTGNSGAASLLVSETWSTVSSSMKVGWDLRYGNKEKYWFCSKVQQSEEERK